MQFPHRITTRRDAKQLVDDLFKLPPLHEMPKDSVGIMRLRMKMTDDLRGLLEWMLTQPKVYQRTRFDLTFGAAQAYEKALNDLQHQWSLAYHGEHLEGIRRLRDAA